MQEKDLFKAIVKAYYENRFEEVVTGLLEKYSCEKEQTAKVIASLCGVEMSYSTSYAAELKKAIENSTLNHKIVTRIKPCSINCTISEGKTSCQKVCAFDAIIIDDENHTTIMDSSKCTDCGFCIEACPNRNYIDKVEFLPLANSL
jgi:Na+-translocating ferredoxin:NAD+ oxidoreductase RNF subunit RnfB